MADNIASEKTLVRVAVRKALAEMPREELLRSDQAMFQALLSLPQVARAGTISLFWGVTGLEPDTAQLARTLVELGKTVCLPRIIADFCLEVRRYTPGCPMARASFGIWEPTIECPPVDKQDVELAVVPALCYDRRGYRMGYGGGYYDRWLADFSGVTVGMCRSLVLRDRLPTEDTDIPVQIVVTEDQILTFS